MPSATAGDARGPEYPDAAPVAPSVSYLCCQSSLPVAASRSGDCWSGTTEEARVAVRHVRRDGLDHLKKLLKDSAISEDDEKRQSADVQKATDQFIAEIDGVTKAEDVTGPYDVIVRAEADTVDELGRLVVARVQSVDGITRTLTCPVVNL